MKTCPKCGLPVAEGFSIHAGCAVADPALPEGWKGPVAPAWLEMEKRIFLHQIAPVIQGAVFRAMLLAGIAYLGAGIVLGILYAMIFGR